MNSEATATASCLQPRPVRMTGSLGHRGSFSVKTLGLLVSRPLVSVLVLFYCRRLSPRTLDCITQYLIAM